MPVRFACWTRVSRSLIVGAAAAATLAIVGCGGDSTAGNAAAVDNTAHDLNFSKSAAGGAGNAAAGRTSPGGAAALPMAAAPKGAKYTIVCASFKGPAHVTQAKNWKDSLISATARREFYVVHEDEQSTLYFGYYREFQKAVDAKESARAEQDLAFVRGLGNAEGQLLFGPQTLVVPLPAAEPEAPAEFDLARIDRDKDKNDPTRRYWSIAIAVYTADATPTGVDAGKSRKQLAVESVLAARQQGVDAYYYNGPNTSLVCIGAWPRNAIREQEADEAVNKYDNGEDIFASNVPLPQSMLDDIEHTGQRVKVVTPKVEIEDGLTFL